MHDALSLSLKKMRRSHWNRHAARGTRRMTLERSVLVSFTSESPYGVASFVVWSELLTLEPGLSDSDALEAGLFARVRRIARIESGQPPRRKHG